MPNVLTRFEIQLPSYGDGTPEAAAVTQFLASIQTLCDTLTYQAERVTMSSNGVPSSYQSCTILYGLITVSQGQTALGFLNTLNAALPAPVICTINQVTQEP